MQHTASAQLGCFLKGLEDPAKGLEQFSKNLDLELFKVHQLSYIIQNN